MLTKKDLPDLQALLPRKSTRPTAKKKVVKEMSPAESSQLDEEISELDKDWVESVPETPMPKVKKSRKNKRSHQGSPKTRASKKTKVEEVAESRQIKIEEDWSKESFEEDTAVPQRLARKLAEVRSHSWFDSSNPSVFPSVVPNVRGTRNAILSGDPSAGHQLPSIVRPVFDRRIGART